MNSATANIDIRKRKRLFRRKKLYADRFLYLLLVPGIAYFVIFRYLPIGGLAIAFKDYNIFAGIRQSPWVGLDNFRDVFASPDFLKILRNTLLISFYKIVLGFPVPIVLALLLNEVRSRSFKRITQTVLYIPHFLSWVVLGGIILAICSPNYGIIGRLVKVLDSDVVNLLGSRRHFRFILVVSEIWKESGWGMIIYLAALSQVDPNLYEAAIVDGATKWQRTWRITLPAISGVIIVLLIIRIGWIMNAGFEQVMVLLNPLVREVGDIFDTYVYRVGLRLGEYSFTTAVGFFKSVVALALLLMADRAAKLIGEEGLI